MDLKKLQELDLSELQDLSLDNIGSWPAYAYIGSIIIAIGLTLGGAWYTLIKPQQEMLTKVQSEETQLRSTFEAKQKKVANLDAYKAQLEEIKVSFGTMLRQLPGKTAMDKLLDDISQTRVSTGLEEQLFKPESEQKKDFYAEKPITLKLSGSYHQLGEFASGIAALPRIVTLHNIKLSKTESGVISMQATAKTYRYLEEE